MATNPDSDVPPPFDLFDLDDDGDALVTSRELQIARSKLGDLLDLLPAGLLIHQEQGIVFANQEAARILGQPGDALVGRHYLDFVAPADVDAHGAHFRACLTGRDLVRSKDGALLAPDGRRTRVQISMSPLPWEGLPVIYVMINDVTALKESEEKLRHLSITDPLTEVANRRHFFEVAERELSRARHFGRPLSVLMMDIDHFKRINDRHGHAVGDEALRVFSAACRSLLRANDLLGRTGGEEFALLMPDTDAAGALRVAERIRAGVADLTVADGADAVRFTVSVGVASGAPSAPSVEVLLSRADEALYRAKAEGRNRVVAAPDPS